MTWILGTSACGSESGPNASTTAAPADATAASTPTGKPHEVGSTIVASTSPVAFVQGKVIASNPMETTFEFGRVDPKTGARPQKKAPTRDTYLLRDALDPAPKKGEHLVCGVSKRSVVTNGVPQADPHAPPAWYPCEVTDTSGAKFRMEDQFGIVHELAPNRLIRPRPKAQQAVGAFVEEERRHRTFDTAFEKSGRPYRPVTWKPKKDAVVVIHFVGTSWYGGRITEVKADRDKVRVGFDSPRWKERDVKTHEVAPQPSAEANVVVDQFVLVRPTAEGERWEHRRVTAVTADSADLVDRSGTKSKAKLADLLPIVASPE